MSVQAAIVAANNAAVPQVYVQWGAKACTAPSGVRVVKLCKYSSFPLAGLGEGVGVQRRTHSAS